MKVVRNTLSLLIETWEDPGDYPSNAGQFPLPPHDYVAGMDGEVHIKLTTDEHSRMNVLRLTDEQGFRDEFETILDDLEVKLPEGIKRVTRWEYRLQPGLLVLWSEGEVVSN